MVSHTIPSRPAFEKGLTLVELLVVLLVISAVTTIAVPAMSLVFPSLQISATAEELSSALRSERIAATRTRRPTHLEIDVENKSFRSSRRGITTSMPKDLEIVLKVARSERVNETIGRIAFYPDGTSTGGSITLSQNSAKTQLSVDWFDGRIGKE